MPVGRELLDGLDVDSLDLLLVVDLEVLVDFGALLRGFNDERDRLRPVLDVVEDCADLLARRSSQSSGSRDAMSSLAAWVI